MDGSVIGTLAGIKRSAMVLGAVGLFFGAADISGQSTGHPSSVVAPSQAAKDGMTQADPWSQPPGVDILSDTQGVDFGPYLKQALQRIKQMWIPLVPEEARPPYNVQSETVIRFAINPDGKIAAMHLDMGSPRQAKFDRAAWGAITGVGQFPPLPKDFTGPNLELRIRFIVNRPPATNP